MIVLFALLTTSSVFAGPKTPKKDTIVVISTSFGDIELILFDETPLHKRNFLKLAGEGFYNGTTFHRIIKGFMIQGGDINSKDADSTNDGMGNVGYTIPAEFNPKFKHIQGAVAAARLGDNVNPKKESSGCQFYIVENKEGARFLDMNYTVFGQVLKGIEVVEAIAMQPKNRIDRPLKDIKMQVKLKKMKRKKITKLYGFNYETSSIDASLIKK
jgi:cyclophilin family peptidyl-prolyl cis-trans isomerase